MAKPLPTDLPYHAFEDAAQFDAFLEQHGASLDAFYLKLAKKTSGIKSITAEEAVEVALCHGWIDGWGRGIDDKWHMKRYTPRRAKSIWSKKNVGTVARLISDGRMRHAGLAQVHAAQKDGRFDQAYGGPPKIEVPEDMTAALAGDAAAAAVFESLDGTGQYSIVWRVQAAPAIEREATLEALVQLLARGQLPGSLGTAGGLPDIEVEAAGKNHRSKRAHAIEAADDPADSRRSARRKT